MKKVFVSKSNLLKKGVNIDTLGKPTIKIVKGKNKTHYAISEKEANKFGLSKKAHSSADEYTDEELLKAFMDIKKKKGKICLQDVMEDIDPNLSERDLSFIFEKVNNDKKDEDNFLLKGKDLDFDSKKKEEEDENLEDEEEDLEEEEEDLEDEEEDLEDEEEEDDDLEEEEDEDLEDEEDEDLEDEEEEDEDLEDEEEEDEDLEDEEDEDLEDEEDDDLEDEEEGDLENKKKKFPKKDKKQSLANLEKKAKNTASVHLINFVQKTNDENLKKIALLELKRRGFDLNALFEENNKQVLEPSAEELLEKAKNKLISDYDDEDLILLLIQEIKNHPSKLKALRSKFREDYSNKNQGNKCLKIEPDQFEDFLGGYFKNFTTDDLASTLATLTDITKKAKISEEEEAEKERELRKAKKLNKTLL